MEKSKRMTSRAANIIAAVICLCALFHHADAALWPGTNSAASAAADLYPTEYGVDHSFPIHYYQTKNNVHKKRYEASMAGCYKQASRSLCDGNERARMEMNRQQPAQQHNYTEIGFKKLRVPDAVFKPLLEFYNKYKDNEKVESWPAGNTYVNHWESPSMMVSFEDRSLRGGVDLKQQIWAGLKPVLEEWTGKKLKPSSLYGVRVYKRGAILATHVDRLPLVSSCIIQVAQDLDEPWPVEVYSHDGMAHNVTMVPGDMTLYESHTVLHGRPFPLNGTMYANVFVHYIPLDHDEVNEHDEELRQKAREDKTGGGGGSGIFDKILGRSAPARNIGGHEQDNHDEASLQRHIAAAHEHSKRHPIQEEEEEDANGPDDPSRTELHLLASQPEEIDATKDLLETKDGAAMINKLDSNGWTPFHEAVRAGSLDVVKLMVEKGADMSIRTKGGGTALWWARRLDANPSVIKYLESVDAPEVGDGL